MTEAWRNIEGYEGMYEVSDCGRVRSIARVVKHRFGGPKVIHERILRQFTNRGGYRTLALSKNGVVIIYRVHSLVALAFIGPPPVGLECCHNDGVRTNNSASNLRYDTREENQADRVPHGTSNRGERQWQSKLTSDQVLAIRIDQRRQSDIALEYGISQSKVSVIKSRKSWGWLSDTAHHP